RHSIWPRHVHVVLLYARAHSSIPLPYTTLFRSGAVRDAVDGARMAVGTLTAVPVRVDRVDRAVAGWAMALAPAVGAGLGAAGAAVFAAALLLRAGGPLSAVLALGLLALLTRALHLDGLADLADGLGSGRPAEEAPAGIARSDIAPRRGVARVYSSRV